MRVFVDTNILISAALFPGSVPDLAYTKAVSAPNEAIISDQVVDELRRIFNRKFPHRMAELDAFIASMSSAVEIVTAPEEEGSSEGAIRDPKDRPILRAAISAGADVLLTGDKDFLESGLRNPRIMTASEFCE